MKQKISTIIVVSIVLSSLNLMIVLDTEAGDIPGVGEAGTTPGVSEWGNATTDLVYGTTYASDTIKINTSLWTDAGGGSYPLCFLYCPKYTSAGAPLSADNFAWDNAPYKVGDNYMVYVTSNEVETDTLNTGGYSILFNRSGMWIFDSNSNHTTYEGYIWVNTSTDYDISSIADFEYNSSGSKTITVQEGENDVGCMIAIIAPDNSTAYHNWQGDGSVTFGIAGNFTMAGDYTVRAYRDFDKDPSVYLYGDENGNAYNNSYGSDYSKGFPDAVTGYAYADVGPWDPPEKNATEEKFTVVAGKPNIKLTNTTQYRSFNGTIDLNVTDSDGMEIPGLNVTILNETGLYPGAYFAPDTDASGTSITANWTNGDTGVWTVVVRNSIAGDDLEEWNNSAEFTVASAPDLQFKWIDDDGDVSDDNNDGEIPAIPSIEEQPLAVKFQVIGNDHTYLDDNESITVSGDALFTGTLDDIPGVIPAGENGTWTVPLTPYMVSGGSTIAFHVEWDGYGTHTEMLKVGGTGLNGSVVEMSPSIFSIDDDVTIEIRVSTAYAYNPYPVMNADVGIYWMKDDGSLGTLINETSGSDDPSDNLYSFTFDASEQNDQPDWTEVRAPRDIIAYVDAANIGYGYATATMNPKSDLFVEVSTSSILAGKKTNFEVNVTLGINETGETIYPDEDIHIEIYDASGDKVTLDDDFGSIRDSDLDELTNSIYAYIVKPGIYTLYAYNNTHDSAGNNATLEVKAVDILCNINGGNELIWSVDENVSIEFTVRYNGILQNGTLEIFNISRVDDYYRAWIGNKSHTIAVIDGVATLENVTANSLPDDSSKEQITFAFKPKYGAYANANDILPVKIPDVSVFPRTIPHNVEALLTIKTTGRGIGLPDVKVNITVPGVSGELSSITKADGTSTFAFKPLTTGNVIIKIEGRISDVTVQVTSWSLYMDVALQVEENEEFIVIVRNGSSTGSPLEGVTVLFHGTTETTNAEGKVTFMAPSVTSTIPYELLATLVGHAEDAVMIQIINVPKLVIILESAEVTAGSEFTVVIADDLGAAIIGATILFDGETYTSSSNGKAKLSAPDEEGTSTITASKANFADADSVVVTIDEKEIPGFELLSLIAALGVSFILFKKRKKN